MSSTRTTPAPSRLAPRGAPRAPWAGLLLAAVAGAGPARAQEAAPAPAGAAEAPTAIAEDPPADRRDGPAGGGAIGSWTSVRDPDARGSLRPGRGIRLTPWLEVQPWARAGAAYDSNVLRSAVDPQGDILGEVGAGVEAVARTRHLRAAASYAISRRVYLAQRGLDSLDHRLSLDLGLERAGPLEDARIGGSLVRVTRPADPRLEGDGGIVDRTSLDLAARATLRLERRLAVRGEGELTREDLEPTDDADADLERFDHRGWAARGALDLRPREDVSLLAGAEVRDIIYTDEAAVAPDLRVVGAFVGGELRGRRLEGQLRVGWEQGRVLRARGATESPGGATLFLRLGWRAAPGTGVALEAQRRVDVSTGSSSQTTTRVGAELSHALSRSVLLEARAGWEQRDPETGPTLHVVRAAVGIGWRALEWLSVGAEVGWDRWRRSTDAELDSVRVGAWIVVAP